MRRPEHDGRRATGAMRPSQRSAHTHQRSPGEARETLCSRRGVEACRRVVGVEPGEPGRHAPRSDRPSSWAGGAASITVENRSTDRPNRWSAAPPPTTFLPACGNSAPRGGRRLPPRRRQAAGRCGRAATDRWRRHGRRLVHRRLPSRVRGARPAAPLRSRWIGNEPLVAHLGHGDAGLCFTAKRSAARPRRTAEPLPHAGTPPHGRPPPRSADGRRRRRPRRRRHLVFLPATSLEEEQHDVAPVAERVDERRPGNAAATAAGRTFRSGVCSTARLLPTSPRRRTFLSEDRPIRADTSGIAALSGPTLRRGRRSPAGIRWRWRGTSFLSGLPKTKTRRSSSRPRDGRLTAPSA